MSLAAVNEILSSCDKKKAVLQIAAYAQSLAEAGEVCHEAEGENASAVWGAAVKFLITKVLCNIEGTKSEKEMRGLYSAPLRRLISALHDDHGTTRSADGVRGPSDGAILTSSSADLLYQHVASIFRTDRYKCCWVDYAHVLQVLVKVPKYSSWMRPEVLVDLLESVHTAFRHVRGKAGEGAAEGGYLETNTTACYACVLQAYPRELSAGVVEFAFSFTTSVLAVSQHHQPPVLLNVLKGLNSVLQSSALDHIAGSAKTLSFITPYLLRLLTTHHGSEALLGEVVASFRHLITVHNFVTNRVARREPSVPATSEPATPPPEGLDDLWSALQRQLRKSVGKMGSVRRDLVAMDKRLHGFVDLMGEVAYLLSFHTTGLVEDDHLEEIMVEDDAEMDGGLKRKGADRFSETRAAKRRRKLHPWDIIVAGLDDSSEVVGFCWLRILTTYVACQLTRECILSTDQLSVGLDAILRYSANSMTGLDSLQSLALDALTLILRVSETVLPKPTPFARHRASVLTPKLLAIREHLLVRLAGGKSKPVLHSVCTALAYFLELPAWICCAAAAPPEAEAPPGAAAASPTPSKRAPAGLNATSILMSSLYTGTDAEVPREAAAKVAIILLLKFSPPAISGFSTQGETGGMPVEVADSCFTVSDALRKQFFAWAGQGILSFTAPSNTEQGSNEAVTLALFAACLAGNRSESLRTSLRAVGVGSAAVEGQALGAAGAPFLHVVPEALADLEATLLGLLHRITDAPPSDPPKPAPGAAPESAARPHDVDSSWPAKVRQACTLTGVVLTLARVGTWGVWRAAGRNRGAPPPPGAPAEGGSKLAVPCRIVAGCLHVVSARVVKVLEAAGTRDKEAAVTAVERLFALHNGFLAQFIAASRTSAGQVGELASLVSSIARKLLQAVETAVKEPSQRRAPHRPRVGAEGAPSAANESVADDAAPAARHLSMLSEADPLTVLLCSAASTAIKRSAEVSARDSEQPLLGRDVRRCVESVWTEAKRGADAFFVANLLSATSDPASVVLCLRKLRELLADKRYKWHGPATTSILHTTAEAVESIESLDETEAAEMIELLRDTVEKLTEVSKKGLLSPEAKLALCRTSMTIVPKAEGQLLGACLEAYLPLLSGASYAVRAEAARHASTLVNLFERPHDVFHSIVAKLAAHFTTSPDGKDALLSGANTKAQTSVLAIAEVCKHSDVMQPTALLQLLLIDNHKQFTENRYLMAQLSSVAESVGAETVAQLVAWHLPFLLRGWVLSKALPLRTFPYNLLGCRGGYAQFLRENTGWVLATVVQSSGRVQLLSSIAATLGADETELLVTHMAGVFAMGYLNYYDDNTAKTAKAVCEDFLKSRLSDERLSVILERNVFAILRTFLRMETAREDCELPKIHSNVADRVFQDFAAIWGHTSDAAAANLLAATPDCAYKLLLCLAEDVLTVGRLAAWRADRFAVLVRYLRRCGSATLAQAHVLRLALHLCLCTARATRSEETFAAALGEAARLCKNAAAASPPALARFLLGVVARLLFLVPAWKPSPAGPADAARAAFDEEPEDPPQTTPGSSSSSTDGASTEARVAACIREIVGAAADVPECRGLLKGAVSPFAAGPPPPALRAAASQYARLTGVAACAWAAYAELLRARPGDMVLAVGLSALVSRLAGALAAPLGGAEGLPTLAEAAELRRALVQVSSGSTLSQGCFFSLTAHGTLRLREARGSVFPSLSSAADADGDGDATPALDASELKLLAAQALILVDRCSPEPAGEAPRVHGLAHPYYNAADSFGRGASSAAAEAGVPVGTPLVTADDGLDDLLGECRARGRGADDEGATWGYEDIVRQLQADVVRSLADAVCAADPGCVAAASETLAAIFADPSGASLAVTQAAGPQLLADLAPFLPARTGPTPGVKRARVATPTLDALEPSVAVGLAHFAMDSFWNPVEAGFAGWVTKAAAALAAKSVPSAASGADADADGAAYFLRACRGACLLLPGVAERVLPLALVDLCVGPAAARRLGAEALRALQRELADKCNRLIFPEAAAVPLAAKVVLRGVFVALMLLREDARRCGVASLETANDATQGPAKQMHTALPRVHDGTVLGLSVAPGRKPAFLRRLDAVSAASASLACGSAAGALRLAEEALEKPCYQGLVPLHADLYPCRRRGAADALESPAREAKARGGVSLGELLAAAHDADAAASVAKAQQKSASTKAQAVAAGARPDEGYHDGLRLVADDPAYKELLINIASASVDDDLLRGYDDGAAPAYRLRHYEQAGDWGNALICANSPADAAQVLKEAGLHQVLSGLQASSAGAMAAWGEKEGPWCTSAFSPRVTGSSAGAAEAFAAALKDLWAAFEARNPAAFHHGLLAARWGVVASDFGHAAGSVASFEGGIAKLKCLEVLDAAWSARTGSDQPVPDATLLAFGLLPPEVDWEAAAAAPGGQQGTPRGSISRVGPAAMPALLLGQVLGALRRGDLRTRAVASTASVFAGAGNVAAALALLHKEPNTPPSGPPPLGSLYLGFLEATYLRSRGERALAVSCLRRVVRTLEGDEAGGGAAEKAAKKRQRSVADDPLAIPLAAALCTLGCWLGEDKTEMRANVIANYLSPAALLATAAKARSRARAYFELARYLDRLYTNLSTRENSAAANLMAKAREKYDECHNFLRKNRERLPSDKQKIIERTSHHLAVVSTDEADRQKKLDEDQHEYLLQSVKSYCLATLHSDAHDLVCIFRIVALWLAEAADAELNQYLTTFFGKLAAVHKFVPLAYQLVSRLSTPAGKGGDRTFGATLAVLLERLGRLHPHHVVYHLSALAHGDYLPDQQRYKEVFVPDTAKVAAARGVLGTLAKTKSVAPLLQEVAGLVDAYMEFAFLPLSKKEQVPGAQIAVADNVKLRHLKSARHAAVASVSIPVNTAGDYSAVPKVREFAATFTTAGGINLPKIIKCLGSDGVWYKQLVKGGQDDLRQDAVLEQMFGLCNDLLCQNSETRRKALTVRTYKVVPLSPTSGVVEWVNNTQPMGEWLLCRANPVRGAHVRYHPHDMTYKEARQLLGSDRKLSDADKQAAFAQVCGSFTPVLHHFFLENYRAAAEWLRCRQAYTRSTAASSMVGYITGLGDRHAQNILLDMSSGEVVHIDLGVAFEKGKFLPIPELVPFRLTRDVVDGMGISGVEGTFRTCCEATLSVLQVNKQLLHTIVEVFIHDPLYNYSLDPSKLLHKQADALSVKASKSPGRSKGVTGEPDRDSGNADAELALLRVTEKLNGYEDGDYLSIEGQVNNLIRTASSLDTLSLMFVGWAAWM